MSAIAFYASISLVFSAVLLLVFPLVAKVCAEVCVVVMVLVCLLRKPDLLSRRNSDTKVFRHTRNALLACLTFFKHRSTILSTKALRYLTCKPHQRAMVLLLQETALRSGSLRNLMLQSDFQTSAYPTYRNSSMVPFQFLRFVFVLLISASLTLQLSSCGNQERNSRGGEKTDAQTDTTALKQDSSAQSHSSEVSISKVTFFIENSGSMLGYVKQANNYINAIVSLAYAPEFDKANKEFYFINGTSSKGKDSQVFTSLIGTDADVLKSNLNPNGFQKYGDPRYSDLTRMFETALGYATGNSISILVSDCIYDVGAESNPLMALKVETEKTKKVFRERLATDDIQTILIKAESDFSGNYYFASKKGSVALNQKRPFYILIFGNSKLLNKYFTEDILTKRVSGYISMVRFMKIDSSQVPYQATVKNRKGSFRFAYSNKNILTDIEKDRNESFQFSIAVDYSSLPFPNSYYENKENYVINLSEYNIVEIQRPSESIPEVPFTPSHLITVGTNSNPFGNLEVSLVYKIPSWIEETTTDDDSNIVGDTAHTFNFKYLTDAVAEAYLYYNKQQHLTTFTIKLSN